MLIRSDQCTLNAWYFQCPFILFLFLFSSLFLFFEFCIISTSVTESLFLSCPCLLLSCPFLHYMPSGSFISFTYSFVSSFWYLTTPSYIYSLSVCLSIFWFINRYIFSVWWGWTWRGVRSIRPDYGFEGLHVCRSVYEISSVQEPLRKSRQWCEGTPHFYSHMLSSAQPMEYVPFHSIPW